jgi:hypothetical protein
MTVMRPPLLFCMLVLLAAGCAAPQQENPTGYDVQMQRQGQENFNETLNPNN